MRIHLSLEPSHFAPQAVAGPSSGPLAQLGGELVIIELQGELGWEGDKEGGVVGVIGLDRPDKPTLHLGEHHLLHGKFANLPKPLAVIRRAVAPAAIAGDLGGAVEGDPDQEEDLDEEDDEEGKGRAKKVRGKRRKDDEDEDEPPLFPPEKSDLHTPPRRHHRDSSSPIAPQPPSSNKGYSSELDFSSPPGSTGWGRFGADEDEDENGDEAEGDVVEGQNRDGDKKRMRDGGRKSVRTMKPERTRVYEVVGVVRRKVVFALRTYSYSYYLARMRPLSDVRSDVDSASLDGLHYPPCGQVRLVLAGPA